MCYSFIRVFSDTDSKNVILTFLCSKNHKVVLISDVELHNAVISLTFTGSLSGIMEGIESHVTRSHQKRGTVGVSSLKVIETALVADKQTLEYHGSYENLKNYVLDVMNVVSTR